MSILAVYADSQLQVPIKVLTHLEDILPILTSAGVSLKTVGESIPDSRTITATQAIEVSGELLATMGVELSQEFAEVLELKGPPGYVEAAADQQHTEQMLAGDSFWLFLDGAATLCMHHDGRLLVLGCRRGDLLELPEGMAHWLVPVTARHCLIVRIGRYKGALSAGPTGDDIASRYPVLEL
ncbi:hypothetical protein [uncultured Halopseudomonas sp.]|uniref:hypothetical protein n=1 Tax=uncultured Halopseudomonas sp. TaxID=2901193 RepID=UPI0030ED44A6|tara:strand:+ start:23005 stop:23550 length:546 start_codon:yes stop_codon:yes gene_type:complete